MSNTVGCLKQYDKVWVSIEYEPKLVRIMDNYGGYRVDVNFCNTDRTERIFGDTKYFYNRKDCLGYIIDVLQEKIETYKKELLSLE